MAAHRFKLILFDFDGTLVDSQANIHRCMAQAFEAEGLQAPTRAAVRRVVGLSLELAIARLLAEHEKRHLAVLAAHYRKAFFCVRNAADYQVDRCPAGSEDSD